VSPVPHVHVPGRLDPTSPQVELHVATLHHLRRVLRLEPGAELSITDGAGASASATLTATGATCTSEVRTSARRAPELVLIQALAKGRRLDDAVRAVCELGVDRIVPVIAGRTQGRPGADERTATRARWQVLSASALEQSRGSWLTHVDEVCTVPDLLDRRDLTGLRLVAVPGADALLDVTGELGAAGGPGAQRVTVAIGPEGGWTPEEVTGMRAAGWLPVGLGPSVLRTEHAGLVALSAVAAAAGRWRPGR
jgi:16S rRNA (uracil1498-N3)-methyltransferase